MCSQGGDSRRLAVRSIHWGLACTGEVTPKYRRSKRSDGFRFSFRSWCGWAELDQSTSGHDSAALKWEFCPKWQRSCFVECNATLSCTICISSLSCTICMCCVDPHDVSLIFRPRESFTASRVVAKVEPNISGWPVITFVIGCVLLWCCGHGTFDCPRGTQEQHQEEPWTQVLQLIPYWRSVWATQQALIALRANITGVSRDVAGALYPEHPRVEEDPITTLVHRHALASVIIGYIRPSRVAKGVLEVAPLALPRNKIWRPCCCG